MVSRLLPISVLLMLIAVPCALVAEDRHAGVPGAGFDDYREDMRRFVATVSAFARHQRPGFLIVVENGLALLDQPRQAAAGPTTAGSYGAAVDGILVKGLNFGPPNDSAVRLPRGEVTPQQRVELARESGLRVLVLDHVDGVDEARQAHRINHRQGFATAVRDRSDDGASPLSGSVHGPHDEHAETVDSLRAVRNFVDLSDFTDWRNEDALAFAARESNFDLVIVDAFHQGRALSRSIIQTLKFKKVGARRLVLAYLDIGRAASDRYYWKPLWQANPPEWLAEPVAGTGGRFYVDFRHPKWQRIIAGGRGSYLSGVIELGFDGVVLGGVDAYRYLETGGLFMPSSAASK